MNPLLNLAFITEVKENREVFDKVQQILENTFAQVQTAATQNKSIAKLSKEVHKSMTMFLHVVDELEKLKNENPQ